MQASVLKSCTRIKAFSKCHSFIQKLNNIPDCITWKNADRERNGKVNIATRTHSFRVCTLEIRVNFPENLKILSNYAPLVPRFAKLRCKLRSFSLDRVDSKLCGIITRWHRKKKPATMYIIHRRNRRRSLGVAKRLLNNDWRFMAGAGYRVAFRALPSALLSFSGPHRIFRMPIWPSNFPTQVHKRRNAKSFVNLTALSSQIQAKGQRLFRGIEFNLCIEID